MAYELTETGKEKVAYFITECAAKRKEILDAGLDTADETNLPTEETILSDLNDGVGVDEEGDYYNGWGVTDHYDSDGALGLSIGEDFVDTEQSDPAKTIACSSLPDGVEVTFMVYSNILKRKVPETGTVLWVDQDKKTVAVAWLDGYKSRTEDIPYEDMLAMYDKSGTEMSFEHIHGPSIKLVAE